MGVMKMFAYIDCWTTLFVIKYVNYYKTFILCKMLILWQRIKEISCFLGLIVETLQPDFETVERELKILYLRRVAIHANPSILIMFVLLYTRLPLNL